MKALIAILNFKLLAILSLTITTFSFLHAQEGGPPMITDDAQVTKFHGWEINTSLNIFTSPDFGIYLPLVDVNYGIFKNTQITLDVPFGWQSMTPNGRWAFMDMNFGIKYQVLSEGKNFISAAVFPKLVFNDHYNNALLLPFYVEKHFGETFYIGLAADYRLIFSGRELFKDNGFDLGLLLGAKINEQIEFMTEFTWQRDAYYDGGILNFGFRRKLSRRLTLMISSGTQVAGEKSNGISMGYIGYFGLKTLL